MAITFDIPLSDGESINLTLTRRGDSLRVTVGENGDIVPLRRGPKPQPAEIKALKPKASEFHQPIIGLLTRSRRALSAAEIKAAVGNGADDNTLSWALVELQFEGCMRGRGRKKIGPIVKVLDGYKLRELKAA